MPLEDELSDILKKARNGQQRSVAEVARASGLSEVELSGLERGQSPRSCDGYSDPNAVERLVEWLGMQWPSLFLATGFCSGRDWEFLGLSLANWSLLTFGGIAGYAALLFVRKD